MRPRVSCGTHQLRNVLTGKPSYWSGVNRCVGCRRGILPLSVSPFHVRASRGTFLTMHALGERFSKYQRCQEVPPSATVALYSFQRQAAHIEQSSRCPTSLPLLVSIRV